MEDAAQTPLIWLDMEMTGLDTETCVPLQVALVLTNDDLEELDALEVTIWQPQVVLERMEPFVRKMHTVNGLLEAVCSSEISVGQAEKAVMTLLTQRCAYGQGILCGNSIHTDRRFIARYLPLVDGYLHYRMIDVSSLKELVVRWYGREAMYNKPHQTHTALSDARESIAELRHYRRFFTKPSP